MNVRFSVKRCLCGGVAFLFFVLCLADGAAAEGEVSGLNQFEYWDNGNVKSCAAYDISGRLKAKVFCRYNGMVEKLERYDPRGNKIEEALFDEKRKLKIGIDGWAAMRWWYNEDSQLISQIAYDEYGKPIERKQYSESGKLVLRQYRDDVKINPYEEASMAMLLGRQNIAYYDAAGKLEEAATLIRE